jgi:hypothetical protein
LSTQTKTKLSPLSLLKLALLKSLERRAAQVVEVPEVARARSSLSKSLEVARVEVPKSQSLKCAEGTEAESVVDALAETPLAGLSRRLTHDGCGDVP